MAPLRGKRLNAVRLKWFRANHYFYIVVLSGHTMHPRANTSGALQSFLEKKNDLNDLYSRCDSGTPTLYAVVPTATLSLKLQLQRLPRKIGLVFYSRGLRPQFQKIHVKVLPSIKFNSRPRALCSVLRTQGQIFILCCNCSIGIPEILHGIQPIIRRNVQTTNILEVHFHT